MGQHRRITLTAIVTLTAICLSATGCRDEPLDPSPTWDDVPAPAPKPEKVDVADPDELAEGTDKAFDFPIPRRMRVEARFDNAVFLMGRVPLAGLNNYIRDRVIFNKVETGPSKTVYLSAALKANPKRVLELAVSNDYGTVELVIRNRSRQPADEGLTEAQRWKRAGLTPDGRVIEKTAE